jgi:hypothetical protein
VPTTLSALQALLRACTTLEKGVKDEKPIDALMANSITESSAMQIPVFFIAISLGLSFLFQIEMRESRALCKHISWCHTNRLPL